MLQLQGNILLTDEIKLSIGQSLQSQQLQAQLSQQQQQQQQQQNMNILNSYINQGNGTTQSNQMMFIPVPVFMPFQTGGYSNSFMMQNDFNTPFSMMQNQIYIQQPQQTQFRDPYLFHQSSSSQSPTLQQQFSHQLPIQPPQTQYQFVQNNLGYIQGGQLVAESNLKQEDEISHNSHKENNNLSEHTHPQLKQRARKSLDESDDTITKKVFLEGSYQNNVALTMKPGSIHSQKKIQKISAQKPETLILAQDPQDLQTQALLQVQSQLNTASQLPLSDPALQDNLILYNRRENWVEKIENPEILNMIENVTSSEELFRIANGNEQASQNILERFNHSISQMTVHDLLKQDKAMFHNQSKLYFNYMLKQVVRYLNLTNLPPQLMQRMIEIAHNIKNSGRRLDAKQVRKTDFYNHSHYNVCYLTINENSIKKFKERDIQLHQQVFQLDLSQGIEKTDQNLLEIVNFYKKCLFEIYRRYFSVSNCEIKKQYHSRAVRGIELMINGKFVQRF